MATCSTNREGSRGTSTSHSAEAGPRTWDRRTNLLEQLNPCTPVSKGIQTRAWTLHKSSAAVSDFEVVQRNLVPKHKGLRITVTLDTHEQEVEMMRQPTTLNAEDQQLLELTFRRKWKQVNHENEQAIMEARNSNQRRRKSKAMSKAWRVITDAFVQSMLIQTAQKPKYMQHKGKTPKLFQATVGGFTKPGKIAEVALQVRQLQHWANKIAGFRNEWKKEERANQQSGRIAEHYRRCDRTRSEMLMTEGHHWLAGPMREIGTEMNEQTMERLVMLHGRKLRRSTRTA